jgi:hypothetical protein
MPIPESSPDITAGDFGAQPKVEEKDLKPEGRAINSVDQAYQVSQRMIYDASRKIRQAAQITNRLNGAPPKNIAKQSKEGKSWQSNTSTGALSTTCSKIPPRLWMPVQNARYLTSASLPDDTPNSAYKNEFYRNTITKAIKSWPKWRFFLQALTREVSYFGYAFAGFMDEDEWRPSLFRMDRGFVPMGTEIMDDNIPFFAVKYDYLPGELLGLVKNSESAGLDHWQKDNVVKAISDAAPPSRSSSQENIRTFEDMLRTGTQWLSYTKGSKVIQTIHLFALEMTGKVSHYILLGDDTGAPYGTGTSDPKSKYGLLYQKLDRFESMADVVRPFVFEFGNGTIQGSLGSGQILYDMSVQVELARNDAFDALKMAGRVKLQVADAKEVNSVKMTVLDDRVIVGGASYQGTNAALSSNVDAFIALDQDMTRKMDEKVGAFLPPSAIPGTSPTATQINVQVQREEEIRNAILENFLTQFAFLVHSIERRLLSPDSPDKISKKTREALLKKLSLEEIELLRDSPPTTTILDFTDVVVRNNAAFAASKSQGPNASLYDQYQLELIQANAMVGLEIAASILPSGEDQNKALQAARQQIIETTTLGGGAPVPVAVSDNHWVHMQTLRPALPILLQQASQDPAQLPKAQAVLSHYNAHYEAGVQQKVIPKDQINPEKGLINSWRKVIESAQARAESSQKIQQVQQAQYALNSGEASPDEIQQFADTANLNDAAQ